MKNLLSITYLVFGLILLKAQETKLDKFSLDIKDTSNFTARQVSKMVVFPGCERIDINNK